MCVRKERNGAFHGTKQKGNRGVEDFEPFLDTVRSLQEELYEGLLQGKAKVSQTLVAQYLDPAPSFFESSRRRCHSSR
jgi:hypothetical protein